MNVIRSEWTKFRSLRSSVYTALLTVAIAVGMGMLISSGQARGYLEATPEERASFDPTNLSLGACFYLAQLAIGVLGVLSVTSEYATGMIRTSLAFVPRRGMFLAAKAVVYGGAAFVLGQVAAFAAYFSGQAMLAEGGAPHTSLGDPFVLRAVAGTGLWLTGVALIGVALGVLLRATAGAFAVLVAVTLVLPLVAGLLPEWFGRWWPTMAGLSVTNVVPNPDLLGPWQGMGLYWSCVAALLGVALAVLRRRDV
ncbi:ABC transporter permease [Virgisporangium aliadipatigenens]|uniref:ABC transporter permease n=1 Tax=Virgisporangium aliadipatigenens TaxID=741659 RepID=A0A8J4DXH8_9ACTN|nr:ABC transporter permease [Virgisporangium aliadipatigenens]GIJ52107.1 ABC transporter permease [Virgisporangium aliadipatigenens]